MASALLVVFFCILLQQARSQTCGAGSTDCKCVVSSSVVFDLTTAFTYPLILNPVSTTSDYQYYFKPCAVFDCGATTPTPSNVCQENSAGTVQYNAGASPKWIVTNSTTATITYSATTGATTRTTTVTVTRSAAVSKATATQVTEGVAKYSFSITIPASGSPSPNPNASSSGDASGYVGFILISIIIAAVIAYFVIGAVIMAKVKGAQGIEIIPNIGFWKDLPFLIKDGVLFLFSPCCGQRFSYTKM